MAKILSSSFAARLIQRQKTLLTRATTFGFFSSSQKPIYIEKELRLEHYVYLLKIYIFIY